MKISKKRIVQRLLNWAPKMPVKVDIKFELEILKSTGLITVYLMFVYNHFKLIEKHA